MNYLGIDYGLSYIGLAFSDGPLASPLKTISRSKALTLIPQIISGLAIDEIVIGLPEGKIQKEVQKFIKDLSFLNIPINVTDETLSSHDARTGLLHTSISRRKKNEHAASATIILQNWLDTKGEVVFFP